MTRDDIIRMAREAGDDVDHTLSSDLDFLERFAALVAATERTACARHFDVAMRNSVPPEREACAQPRPAEPAAEEDDGLYWRLHAMSKSLEGAGRLDEHDNPDVYGTVLDAMNLVKQHRGQRGEE